MIIFDNTVKNLEVPSGLGNLEINIQQSVNVDPVTVAEIYSAISASSAETIVVAQEYTDASIDAQEFKTINGSAITGSGNLVIEGGGSSEKAFVLEDLSQADAAALYAEIYSACTLGEDERPDTKTFPAQNYKFYGKIEQDAFLGLVEMYLARYESTNSFTFTGVAGSRWDSKNLFIKVIRIRYNGQIDVNQTNVIDTASTVNAAVTSANSYTDSAITEALSGFTGGTSYTAGSGISISNTNVISCTIDTNNLVNNSKDVQNLWMGTKAQYEAISSTTYNTIYFITD